MLSQSDQHSIVDQSVNRIYLVTDRLRSKATRTNYRLAFNAFLKHGAHTADLQVLLDYKPRVLESMVIGYIEWLRDRGMAHKTIQLHCAAIFHFFEMNDIVLNKRKVMKFVPPDESAHDEDKAYSVDEIHHRCVICGRPKDMVELIIHHKRPLNFGGKSIMDNMLTVGRKHQHCGNGFFEDAKIWNYDRKTRKPIEGLEK